MPKLIDDVRASMTECVASFFAASQKLKDVDISDYCESNQEAETLICSLKLSESVTGIEQLKIYNKRFVPSEDLVEEHAQIVQMSSELKNLDSAGKNMSASFVATLLSTLLLSESRNNFVSIPKIKGEHFKDEKLF